MEGCGGWGGNGQLRPEVGETGPIKGAPWGGLLPLWGHLRGPLQHGHGQGVAVLQQAFLASKGSSFWKPSPVNSLVPTFTFSKPVPPQSQFLPQLL